MIDNKITLGKYFPGVISTDDIYAIGYFDIHYREETTYQCDSTGCDGHIHTDAIDDVLGDDEYGVMPLSILLLYIFIMWICMRISKGVY